MTAGRARRVRHHRPADGRHQRLHARAGQRPVHHRRRRSTTGCGAPTGSSPTPSRCTRRSSGGGGFYPPDEVIPAQTARNREAVLLLARVRRLPVPGHRQAGPVLRRRRRGTTVYSDTFETATGWTTNPGGTDTATLGAWERGDPAGDHLLRRQAARHHGQRRQRPGDRPARRRGGRRLRRRRRRDVDPVAADHAARARNLTLSFSWYLAHGSNASSADYLRVSVGGSPVFQQLGSATNGNGAWASPRGRSRPSRGRPCGSSSRRPTRRPRAWSRRAWTT